MAKFVVLEDNGLGTQLCNDSVEVEADSPEEAARVGSGSSHEMHAKPFGGAPNVWRCIDDVSHHGWGPGCKYEGKQPDHQWIVLVIQR